MSFISRIFKTHNQRNVALSSSTSFSPFSITADGAVMRPNVITPSVALQNSDIYAIISRISSNIAAMRYKTDNPMLNRALSRPSNVINAFSFWQKCIVQMLLTGNAYVLINRDDSQNPISFTQLPASDVQINILSRSAGDAVDDVVYTVTLETQGNKTFTVSSKDVLHFRCLVSGSDAQTNGYCGISPLVSLADEINIQDRSNSLSQASLAHAIAPTYALKIPGVQVSNEDKENLRSNFEASISHQNAGRPVILDKSMDVAPLATNSDIDKLLSNTQFAQSQIAKAFNIPAEYLNGKGNEQSSMDQMTNLYVNALAIYINPILSEMSLKFDTDVRCDMSQLSDVDHQQLINNVAKLTSGTNPVLPASLAIQMLRDADALNLGDVPDSVINKAIIEGGGIDDNTDS